MEGEIKWGILGTGKIAHDFATAIRVVPNTRVVAVGSRTEETAEEFAKEFNIPKFYGSYDLLVEDPEVNVIYVATPHTEHHQCTIMALDAKKNVLCEKPLAINLKEAENMIKLAKNQGVFLMEGHWTRFFPVYKRMRELITNGAIGDVVCVNADFGFVNDPPTERLQNPELGGGSLLDIGVYPIEVISMIFGLSEKQSRKPSQVEVIAHISENQVDDLVAGVIKYGPSEIGVFSCSTAAHIGGSLKISGTKGRIEVGFPFWAPSSLTLEVRDTDRITEDYPLPKNDGYFNFRNSEGLAYEVEEVNNCISNGATECLESSLEESLTIISILDCIRDRIGLQYPQDA